jgi:hypothetical protein
LGQAGILCQLPKKYAPGVCIPAVLPWCLAHIRKNKNLGSWTPKYVLPCSQICGYVLQSSCDSLEKYGFYFKWQLYPTVAILNQ